MPWSDPPADLSLSERQEAIGAHLGDIDSTGSHSESSAAAISLQLCPTLHDPIDGSPPGSPAPGILQARTLVWVAISFSKHESEK